MSQSSCKRDTKSKSHPGMKLAAVGDITDVMVNLVDEKHETNYCVSFVAVEIIGIIRATIYSLTDIFD